jgi:hypothetical protein
MCQLRIVTGQFYVNASGKSQNSVAPLFPFLRITSTARTLYGLGFANENRTSIGEESEYETQNTTSPDSRNMR